MKYCGKHMRPVEPEETIDERLLRLATEEVIDISDCKDCKMLSNTVGVYWEWNPPVMSEEKATPD